MGLCSSDVVDKNEDEINKALQADFMAERKIIKTLLLGTGESGKTTIFKQMVKIHGTGLSREKLDSYHSSLRRNCIESIISLARQSVIFADEKKEECAVLQENQDCVEYVLKLQESLEEENFLGHSAKYIERLWQDPGIQASLKYHSLFVNHMIDNAPYFLDKVSEIFKDNYVVTEDDALRCRVMSTGMTEEMFDLNQNLKMRLVDVGGQRSERRKWMLWFDGVAVIMFVVAVSEFDQKLYEDIHVSRFDESMNVFSDVVTNPIFAKTRFLLFLNKIDLFEEKIKRLNVKDYVSDFNGVEHDLESCIQFFERKYLEIAKDVDLGVFRSSATDSTIMEVVINNVITALLQRYLGNAGLF